MHPKKMLLLATIAALTSSASTVLHAQATGAKPPTHPARASGGAMRKGPGHATARCTDNSWSMAAAQQGACSQHGGVATWFGKKPRGAAARCNDGQYWETPERQGACSGHDGVAAWYKKAMPAKSPAKKGA